MPVKLLVRRRWIFCTALFLFASRLLAGTNYPPADHAGADLILSDGDVIWGVHTNVRRFEVKGDMIPQLPFPRPTTVTVRPYHPEDIGSGRLDVYADDIIISGTLSAEGVGYTGGAGPGGVGASGSLPEYAGDDGINGQPRYSGYPGSQTWPNRGDGPFGGSPNHQNESVRNGGYDAPDANLDMTTDTKVLMGSGGAGGYGTVPFNNSPGDCSFPPVGGTGGSSAGGGGGAVRLFALQTLVIHGSLETMGAIGTAGFPGKKGSVNNHVSPCIAIGGDGGNGADGLSLNEGGNGAGDSAGGGVMLFCSSPEGLEITGFIDARSSEWRYNGANVGIRSGGTIKIFHANDAVTTSSLKAGRIYMRNIIDEPLPPIDRLLGKTFDYAPSLYDSNSDLIVDAADLMRGFSR